MRARQSITDIAGPLAFIISVIAFLAFALDLRALLVFAIGVGVLMLFSIVAYVIDKERQKEIISPGGISAPEPRATIFPEVFDGLCHFPSAIPQPVPTESLEKEPQQMAWLVIRSGSRVGKAFHLGEVTNIGREAALNDIVIDDPAVSLQHARIRVEEGQFVLYDLASANCTFVNDQQIQKHILANKDVIRMGNTALVFMQV